MIPVLSAAPIPAPWVERVNAHNAPLIDYETGGAELGVGSDSVAYEWKVESDGSSVWVSREGVAPVVVLTDTDITEVSLAFDQTMNPHIAYVAGGVAKFYWWDTLANAYATMALASVRSPRCCSDEKSPLLPGDRDLLLAYMRGSTLYVRAQRDRFGTEYTMTPDAVSAAKITATTRLVSVGMNTGRRLQFRLT